MSTLFWARIPFLICLLLLVLAFLYSQVFLHRE